MSLYILIYRKQVKILYGTRRCNRGVFGNIMNIKNHWETGKVAKDVDT